MLRLLAASHSSLDSSLSQFDEHNKHQKMGETDPAWSAVWLERFFRVHHHVFFWGGGRLAIGPVVKYVPADFYGWRQTIVYRPMAGEGLGSFHPMRNDYVSYVKEKDENLGTKSHEWNHLRVLASGTTLS